MLGFIWVMRFKRQKFLSDETFRGLKHLQQWNNHKKNYFNNLYNEIVHLSYFINVVPLVKVYYNKSVGLTKINIF